MHKLLHTFLKATSKLLLSQETWKNYERFRPHPHLRNDPKEAGIEGQGQRRRGNISTSLIRDLRGKAREPEAEAIGPAIDSGSPGRRLPSKTNENQASSQTLAAKPQNTEWETGSQQEPTSWHGWGSGRWEAAADSWAATEERDGVNKPLRWEELTGDSSQRKYIFFFFFLQKGKQGNIFLVESSIAPTEEKLQRYPLSRVKIIHSRTFEIQEQTMRKTHGRA